MVFSLKRKNNGCILLLFKKVSQWSFTFFRFQLILRMLKLIVLTISIISLLGNAFSQSLKKQNALLLIETEAIIKQYDSLLNLESEAKNNLSKLNLDFDQSTEKKTLDSLSLLLTNHEANRQNYTVLTGNAISMSQKNFLIYYSKKLSEDLKDFHNYNHLPYIYNDRKHYEIDDSNSKDKTEWNNYLLALKDQVIKDCSSIKNSLLGFEEASLKSKEKLALFKKYIPLFLESVQEFQPLNLKEKTDSLKRDFQSKGPEGFADAYFTIFPDVYPEKSKILDPDYGAVPPPPPINNPSTIYEVVDESAEFPGGLAEAKKFIQRNLIYPESALDENIEGKCYVKFMVSDEGVISNITVQKGVPNCNDCDKEAIRLVKSMPKWKPAKINGKAVNSYFVLPVPFKIG